MDRAKLYLPNEAGEEIPERPHRSRIGEKRSKPEHNLENLSESDLRKQRVEDQVWSCKFKKRKRRDLTVAEIEGIVSACKEPYRLHKDVA